MNKSKKLTIRLSESQMKRLSDTLIEEKITKSQIIREIIDKHIRSYRKKNKSNVIQKIIEIKDINNENQ